MVFQVNVGLYPEDGENYRLELSRDGSGETTPYCHPYDDLVLDMLKISNTYGQRCEGLTLEIEHDARVQLGEKKVGILEGIVALQDKMIRAGKLLL